MVSKKKKTKVAPTKSLTRKELRKQKQQLKIENKRRFFSGKTKDQQQKQKQQQQTPVHKQTTKSNIRNLKTQKLKTAPEDIPIEKLLAGVVDSDQDESIPSDFSDEEVDARLAVSVKPKPQPAPKKVKIQTAPRPDAAEAHRRELLRQKDLENASRKQRIKQLAVDNEEDDKIIAKLEKKLKLNKTKDKNRLVRKMFNDGLDYLLEYCLDDDEERAKQELRKKRREETERKQAWSDDEENSEGDDLDNMPDDSESLDSGQSEEEEENDATSDVEEGEEDEEKDDFKEDIYGRKRDKDGNLIVEEANSNATQQQKYIPPHQRALLALESGDAKQTQTLARLHRGCKGLLNRLSEANLHKIAMGIEEFYMKNSRHNMNETLTSLLNEALVSKTLANERMVQEHMVLLAYLHANIGSEIGAHFLQMFIEQFHKFIGEIQTLAVQDKRLNNIVMILSYLYIFKIYEHRLLLELIARLADNLCEKSIECMLLLFQSVGFRLRKDDPLAFKRMMAEVQQKIAAAPLEMKENLRLRFMVDILNAVKNNNISKLPQFDPELAENLRKRLKAMLRNDKYVITLNITMDDLLRADKVGKWWIVGSAWSGNMDDLASASQSHKANGASGTTHRFSEKLLALARKQKMNTDERRNIFCIIMSAEDYVDAFEKILHLALKDQRGIAYVILHCCLNEKQVNPYYAHLALRFCNYNRKFQLAFQFASWDRINEIESLSKVQIKNLAKFLQHLISSGGLLLSVLKVVDFLKLDNSSFLFMREVCVGLLLGEVESEVYQVFERVAKNTKLAQFKQSIRLFLQHFLLQQEGAKLKLNDDQLLLLRKRVDYVDKILAYVDL